MLKRMALILLLMVTVAFSQTTSRSTIPSLSELRAMTQRFAPTPLRVDTSRLSAGDRQALAKLIEAARVLNPLFLEQLWDRNLATYERLKQDKTALGRARLHYYWINKSPWSNLDDEVRFMPGVPRRKPLGANFYPLDMTKQEFETWVKTLPEKEQEAARGFFTVIRRVYPADVSEKRRGRLVLKGKSLLVAIPYSEEYRQELEKAAGLLREAAALTANESLKRFLNTRAAAFLSNDYYESDVAWMELDAPLDVTIGPYETYQDELLGYKAAFEAYINLRDDAETAKLSAFGEALQELENNLPIDPKYRNPKLGPGAPLRVVNEIFAAGDADRGIATAAYNLPNDERVVKEKGSKRVLLKNVQEAKFRSVLQPISQRTLAKRTSADVSFDAFFTHILAHELMHGLGPQQITVDGRSTSPRQELKEVYSAVEEAKADATGLWALQYMMDNAERLKLGGILRTGEAAERQIYTTFLASAFRTLRFGISSAHGRGMALQFNYLLDKGGFLAQPDGTFAVDFNRIKDAVRDLTRDLLTLEAAGDYGAAKEMLETSGVIRPVTQRALDKLRGIPVDVELQFVTAEEIAPEARVENKTPPRRKPRRP